MVRHLSSIMASLLHETPEACGGDRTASAISAPTSSARSLSPTIDGMQEKEKSNVDIEAKDQSSERPALSSTEEFPEGGLRAWSVVWGGFFAFIATFGVTNSYVGHSFISAVARMSLQMISSGRIPKLLPNNAAVALIIIDHCLSRRDTIILPLWRRPYHRSNIRRIRD